MSSGRHPLIAIVLAGTLAAMASPAWSGQTAQGRPATPAATTPIKHIVFLMKENRSYDEYFGRFPGADGATSGLRSNGQRVTLGQTPDPMPNDIGHGPDTWITAYDKGRMDGFDKEQGAVSRTGQLLSYTQMSESQIPAYWAYARRYGLGDRMFSDWKGGSFGNNVFMVAAQTGRYDPGTNFSAIYKNPVSPSVHSLNYWGCDDPPDTRAQMFTASGAKSSMFPCYGFKSLPDTLQADNVSWGFFANEGNKSFVHVGVDAIKSVHDDPAKWSNVQPLAHFTAEAGAGTLPAVSWVEGVLSDHAFVGTTVCAGENETAGYVNAIMSGPDWASTMIVITWDEWGGFYDHVVPPQVDNVSFGFRVPLLVISPYVKRGAGSDGGYVSHTTYSFASMLRTVERNWNLPSLTPRDAAANDLFDFLDFSAAPKPPLLEPRRACPSITAKQARDSADMVDD